MVAFLVLIAGVVDFFLTVGVPDDKWGERVMAVVIPRESVDGATLAAYCREKLAAYKRPKEYKFIEPDDMPRTATGKILHRRIRETLTDR